MRTKIIRPRVRLSVRRGRENNRVYMLHVREFADAHRERTRIPQGTDLRRIESLED